MTATQTGVSSYGARIRRAQQLSKAHSFASEFLDLYAKIASFQESLYTKIAAASGKTGSDPAGTAIRAELDLTVLLPFFRGYLSIVEQNAPAALAESAHRTAILPTDSWIMVLEEYWKRAGAPDELVGAFEQFIPRAFLQPYAEFRAASALKPPVVVAPRVCPLCGSRPLLGVLRPEGDGGKRFLLCSFCCQEWEFRRILCPTCGEEAEAKLPVYVAEQLPHMRVETCDTCKSYVNCVDLTKNGNAIPLVDDLAAIPLTLWAHEHGYSRLQPNLLGT